MKAVIQTILDASVTDSDLVIFDNNRAALQLCFTLEKIFTHGLIGSWYFIYWWRLILIKSYDCAGTSLLFAKKYFWVLFDRLPRNDMQLNDNSTDMTVDTMLSIAQEEGKNNLARGRIFLRLALNNHSLTSHLRYLFSNPSIIKFADQFLIQRLIKQIKNKKWSIRGPRSTPEHYIRTM